MPRKKVKKIRKRLTHGNISVTGSDSVAVTKTIRKKKEQDINETINIFDTEKYGEVNKPNDLFCIRCKNSEVRGLKDTIIDMFATINMVSTELGIEHNNWKVKCKKLREWARKQSARKPKRKVTEDAKTN